MALDWIGRFRDFAAQYHVAGKVDNTRSRDVWYSDTVLLALDEAEKEINRLGGFATRTVMQGQRKDELLVQPCNVDADWHLRVAYAEQPSLNGFGWGFECYAHPLGAAELAFHLPMKSFHVPGPPQAKHIMQGIALAADWVDERNFDRMHANALGPGTDDLE